MVVHVRWQRRVTFNRQTQAAVHLPAPNNCHHPPVTLAPVIERLKDGPRDAHDLISRAVNACDPSFPDRIKLRIER